MAYEIPGLRYSAVAGDEIERYTFVSVNDKEEGIPAKEDSPIIGVAMNDPSKGQVLEIARGIVMVAAAAPMASGEYVKSDAKGKAVKGTKEDNIGIAITGTEAANGFVSVLID